MGVGKIFRIYRLTNRGGGEFLMWGLLLWNVGVSISKISKISNFVPILNEKISKNAIFHIQNGSSWPIFKIFENGNAVLNNHIQLIWCKFQPIWRRTLRLNTVLVKFEKSHFSFLTILVKTFKLVRFCDLKWVGYCKSSWPLSFEWVLWLKCKYF